MAMHCFIIFLYILSYGFAQETLGVNCDDNNVCFSMFGTDSECHEKFCVCKDGDSKPVPCDSKKVKNTNFIGGICVNATQCMTEKSECDQKTKKCVCLDKYVQSGDNRRCLVVAHSLGDKCTETVQCSHDVGPLSVCNGDKCVCQNGTTTAKDRCWSPSDIGKNCTSFEECSHIHHSDCVDEICKCKENYVPKIDGKNCLPVAKQWDAKCLESSQCHKLLGNGFNCLNGFCRCSEQFHLNMNKTGCVKDTGVGIACTHHTDCHPPGAEEEAYKMECILGECQCRYPFIQDNGFCNDDAVIAKPVAIYIYALITIIYYIY